MLKIKVLWESNLFLEANALTRNKKEVPSIPSLTTEDATSKHPSER
jgi:hypothetical protein